MWTVRICLLNFKLRVCNSDWKIGQCRLHLLMGNKRISSCSQHMNTEPLDEVEFSHRRYNIERENFSKVNQQDIERFRQILQSSSAVVTDPEELVGWSTDWLKIARGSAPVLLKPSSTTEVSQIMKYCNDNNLAVVPQGGKTGLVGGSVPVFDEIIVSTARLNNVISLDKVAGTLVCEAGCILQNLDELLETDNFMLPYDLGARGSCHIGGNLATNAGGIRLLRYGSLHGNVLGVEVVLANGTVLDCLSTCRKDNTGYDLKQLFIGSEGTLGLITKVAIILAQKPKASNVALVGCQDFDTVKAIFTAARSNLGEYLSACEFMDAQMMSLVETHLGLRKPLQSCPFYILIEASGMSDVYCKEGLLSFLELLMEDSVVQDGVVASSSKMIKDIWSLRERILEACQCDGYVIKYDASLPLDVYYDLVVDIRSRVGNLARCVGGYGHIGDGNIHINITSDGYKDELMKKIEPYIYEWIGKRKGSISAEHGLGIIKKKYMRYSNSESAYKMMRGVKRLFDPKGILNPYKTIPETYN